MGKTRPIGALVCRALDESRAGFRAGTSSVRRPGVRALGGTTVRDAREELRLVDGVRQSMATLRLRAEMLPEGHRVREDVEAYLQEAEKKVDDELAAIRGYHDRFSG